MNTNEIKIELNSIKLVDDVNIIKLRFLCNEICDNNLSQDFIPILFDILENNPNYDFGTPGFIIHTLEKFYKNGLETELLKSVNRKPTFYTVWMINRILNATKDKGERNIYISTLKDIVDKLEDGDIKKQAQHFIDIQTINE